MGDRQEQPEVIAEAGSNHNGSVARAVNLIDIARSAGASSVKFQFIFPENLYLPAFRDGRELRPNPAHSQRRTEQLTESEWSEVWRHGQRAGIPLSASVFCDRGIDLLSKLGAGYVKIASTDLTNRDLIALAATRFDRVIVSTGMATLSEVAETVAAVQEQHRTVSLELMHCVSSYPCPVEDANPQRVRLLKDAFALRVGYSDHTEGSLSAILALSQGADLFEKHFTDDRSLPGFDHANAASPDQLQTYIDDVCQAAVSLSGHPNRNSTQEVQTRIRARRGVYAARDLPAGHVLTRDDLLHVRPSTAQQVLPSQLVGKPLATDVQKFEALGPADGVGVIESRWPEAATYWVDEMDEKGMTPQPSETVDRD